MRGDAVVQTDAQRRANLKSRKKNAVQLNVPLWKSSDGDIIEHLQALKDRGEGQSDYIRRLIREDMAKTKEEGAPKDAL